MSDTSQKPALPSWTDTPSRPKLPQAPTVDNPLRLYEYKRELFE
jgi:hypothetical protein